jgi:chemotaxis protein methyltransferase CheR
MERHRASPELAHLHAVLLLAAGRHAEAADAARRALYLDRGFAAAHLALGLARERLGERDAALRAFRAAEQALAGLPPAAPVPGADGETAGGLREMLRVRIRLLREPAL